MSLLLYGDDDMEKKTEEYTDITAWVREELLRHAEEAYGEFHKSLVPGLESMLGVRVPNIRKIAKKAAKIDYYAYAKEADLSVYEELMIRGMMIGYACLTMEEQKTELRKFVPHINNWAVCDCCCATYKFMKKNQEDWFSFLEEYVYSHSEYQVRFAVVCMLDFFICEAFLERVLDLLSQIRWERLLCKKWQWPGLFLFATSNFPGRQKDSLQRIFWMTLPTTKPFRKSRNLTG